MSKENNKILSTLREQITDVKDWPSKVDVAGSAFSLFTIQYTYRIPVVDLAGGILGERITSAKLTVEDIEDIVNNRLEDHNTISHFPGKDYALAIEWVEGAIGYLLYILFRTEFTELRYLTSSIKSIFSFILNLSISINIFT